MSNFLILSEHGAGLGLALRLKAEGHSSKMKVFDVDYEGLGHGIVDCACEYTFGETIIADCVGFGHVLEAFRDGGVRIFGGGVFADSLEADRQLSEEVFDKADIQSPRSVRAESWDDAVKLVKTIGEDSERVVLKPEGGLSGIVPSFVAHNVEEALESLKKFEAKAGSAEVALTIQEYIKGIAMSTEGWFNGEDFIPGMFNHTIERKEFLNGDLGPSTGCTGNLVWSCDADDPVVSQTLQKLTVLLREHRYVGPIDINCIVNKGGIYALEFTPRFGYDAFPTLLYSLCDFDFGGLVEDMARGNDSGATLNPGFGCGIRVGVPPWPSEESRGEAGIVIRGLKEGDWQWFYPYEVTMHEGELQSSRGFGCLGVINGHGQIPGEAFARAYRIASGLEVRNLQYRTDLCEVINEDFRELRGILGDGGSKGWIGVDLDGTLATYNGWSDDIGEPIPRMVQRVKRWLREGKDVRILTARGSIKEGRYEQLCKIYDWCAEHIGEVLEVTSSKDPHMVRLYDDRVVKIDANEGTIA